MKKKKNNVAFGVAMAIGLSSLSLSVMAKETVINITPEVVDAPAPVVKVENKALVDQVVVVAEVQQPKQRVKVTEKESTYNGSQYKVAQKEIVTDKYAMTQDDAKLLHEKDYLDPNQDIIATQKKYEQNIEKRYPDEIVGQYSFFNHKPTNALSERMYIDEREGKIYFRVKQGTLRSNIVDLMAETRNTKHLVYKVGAHKVFGDYWVTGQSMFEIVNNMLTPYKQPEQIMFGIFNGETIAVFYENQQEFWN